MLLRLYAVFKNVVEIDDFLALNKLQRDLFFLNKSIIKTFLLWNTSENREGRNTLHNPNVKTKWYTKKKIENQYNFLR
jgi:hypothetical protein